MNKAYKIISKQIWQSQLSTSGYFTGFGNDIRDHFIHLSTGNQVKRTAEKWFRNESGLILICVNLDLIAGVKWEKARDNDIYPHVYGVLKQDHVLWIKDFPFSSEKEWKILSE